MPDDVFPEREYMYNSVDNLTPKLVHGLVGILLLEFTHLVNSFDSLIRHLAFVPYLRARGFTGYSDTEESIFHQTMGKFNSQDFEIGDVKDFTQVKAKAFVALCKQLLDPEKHGYISHWHDVFDDVRNHRNSIAHLTASFWLPEQDHILELSNDEEFYKWMKDQKIGKRPERLFKYTEKDIRNIIGDIRWLDAHARNFSALPGPGAKDPLTLPKSVQKKPELDGSKE